MAMEMRERKWDWERHRKERTSREWCRESTIKEDEFGRRFSVLLEAGGCPLEQYQKCCGRVVGRSVRAFVRSLVGWFV